MDGGVVDWHWVGFFDLERIARSVDGGVDSEREEVLVVRGEDAWCHDGAVADLVVCIDGAG